MYGNPQPDLNRQRDLYQGLLLKLNRDQLRWVVGHCHLKGHLFKLGLTDDPICERCLEEDEQPHVSCVIMRP
jgi:hypothetical protein